MLTKFFWSTVAGLSGRSGEFTPEVMKLMTKNTECPIIFSLSNPLIKAEATAAEVYSSLKVHNHLKNKT